jgi:protein required for attachment to host cells
VVEEVCIHKASIPHDALVSSLTARGRYSCGTAALIVVALPKVPGTLRKSFQKGAKGAVEAEVPKEVASYSLHEIRNELAGWW